MRSQSQSVGLFRKGATYACKGRFWPCQARQVGTEPILAATKAAAEMLPHEDSCVSKAGLTSFPQASGVGQESSLHPAFALFVLTSVSFTALKTLKASNCI